MKDHTTHFDDCGCLSAEHEYCILDRDKKIKALEDEVQKLNDKIQRGIKAFHEVEQTLGKALDYPWYKDDQKNFPGATEADGVCTGDNVAETLALEAAHRIEYLFKLTYIHKGKR
jgi:hypothetical protein